ncbi:hypothetical protein SAMN03159341_12810 [Paenibacillus sp. 1_12]|nr:hypothetical protein SAMN03159341_12810 [Paenibacillus sp. 1_12]
MFNGGSSSPTLTHVTISGNLGGMYNTNNSNPNIRNSIVWGNTNGSGYNVFNDSSKPNINHSIIEGSGVSDNIWDKNLGFDGGGT